MKTYIKWAICIFTCSWWKTRMIANSTFINPQNSECVVWRMYVGQWCQPKPDGTDGGTRHGNKPRRNCVVTSWPNSVSRTKLLVGPNGTPTPHVHQTPSQNCNHRTSHFGTQGGHNELGLKRNRNTLYSRNDTKRKQGNIKLRNKALIVRTQITRVPHKLPRIDILCVLHSYSDYTLWAISHAYHSNKMIAVDRSIMPLSTRWTRRCGCCGCCWWRRRTSYYSLSLLRHPHFPSSIPPTADIVE